MYDENPKTRVHGGPGFKHAAAAAEISRKSSIYIRAVNVSNKMDKIHKAAIFTVSCVAAIIISAITTELVEHPRDSVHVDLAALCLGPDEPLSLSPIAWRIGRRGQSEPLTFVPSIASKNPIENTRTLPSGLVQIIQDSTITGNISTGQCLTNRNGLWRHINITHSIKAGRRPFSVTEVILDDHTIECSGWIDTASSVGPCASVYGPLVVGDSRLQYVNGIPETSRDIVTAVILRKRWPWVINPDGILEVFGRRALFMNNVHKSGQNYEHVYFVQFDVPRPLNTLQTTHINMTGCSMTVGCWNSLIDVIVCTLDCDCAFYTSSTSSTTTSSSSSSTVSTTTTPAPACTIRHSRAMSVITTSTNLCKDSNVVNGNTLSNYDIQGGPAPSGMVLWDRPANLTRLAFLYSWKILRQMPYYSTTFPMATAMIEDGRGGVWAPTSSRSENAMITDTQQTGVVFPGQNISVNNVFIFGSLGPTYETVASEISGTFCVNRRTYFTGYRCKKQHYSTVMCDLVYPGIYNSHLGLFERHKVKDGPCSTFGTGTMYSTTPQGAGMIATAPSVSIINADTNDVLESTYSLIYVAVNPPVEFEEFYAVDRNTGETVLNVSLDFPDRIAGHTAILLDWSIEWVNYAWVIHARNASKCIQPLMKPAGSTTYSTFYDTEMTAVEIPPINYTMTVDVIGSSDACLSDPYAGYTVILEKASSGSLNPCEYSPDGIYCIDKRLELVSV